MHIVEGAAAAAAAAAAAVVVVARVVDGGRGRRAENAPRFAPIAAARERGNHLPIRETPVNAAQLFVLRHFSEEHFYCS